MQKVRKAVIPAAGLGNRLYPMTVEQPKEMLPIGGRPMIYYAVLEAALSGLEELYVVISRRKEPLRSYLEQGGLQKDLQQEERKERIHPPLMTFVDQPCPLGSGEAIYRTREMTGNEAFALMMPDFLLFGRHPALAQMIPLYEHFEHDTVGVLALGARETNGFSNVGVAQATRLEEGVVEVHSFSGKSQHPLILEDGETIFKLAGRWILGPHFFSYLERARGGMKEWDETPALLANAQHRKVIGKILEGRGFDVGNPIGYQSAKEKCGSMGDQIFPA